MEKEEPTKLNVPLLENFTTSSPSFKETVSMLTFVRSLLSTRFGRFLCVW